MAARTLGKVKSSFQELLDFSKKELATGRGDLKDDLMTFAKRTTTIVRGQPVSAQTFPSAVNPEVGGLILLHFLILHNRIHEEATACSQKASDTDTTLQAISKVTLSWRKVLESCDIEFALLPDLVKSVQSAKEKIASINCKLHAIHRDLYQLEVLNAKLDNERKKNSLLLQLKMHKTNKENEISLLRDKASAKEHELTVLRTRVAERAATDRQEAFREMFTEDCQQFISTGKLEREASLTSSTKSLDEIDFEDEEGKKCLDQFLEDVPLSPPPTGSLDPTADALEPPSGTEEPSSGNQEPPSGTEEPSSGNQEPPSGTEEPSSGNQEPPSGTEEPSSGNQEPPSELPTELDS